MCLPAWVLLGGQDWCLLMVQDQRLLMVQEQRLVSTHGPCPLRKFELCSMIHVAHPPPRKHELCSMIHMAHTRRESMNLVAWTLLSNTCSRIRSLSGRSWKRPSTMASNTTWRGRLRAAECGMVSRTRLWQRWANRWPSGAPVLLYSMPNVYLPPSLKLVKV